MTKYATPVQTRRFVIMIVSLLSCINNLAQGQPPNDIYNELSLPNPSKDQLPSSNSDSLHLSSDEGNNPRLQDLLLLKQSLSEVLSKVPELDDKDYENEDHPEETKQIKRVFCNGFTGCGGRFRGRRRQQQPVEEIGKRRLPNFGKRPFCNSYGCFNSGKKRFNQLSIKNKTPHVTALADDWLEDKIKRLFCNSYGGCQNVGKRSVVMDTEVAKTVAEENETLSKSLLNKLGTLKQDITSDVDEDMDELISTMRR